MPVELICECTQKVIVEDADVGRVMVCPRCGRQIAATWAKASASLDQPPEPSEARCIVCNGPAQRPRDSYWCHGYVEQRLVKLQVDQANKLRTEQYTFEGLTRLEGVVCPACGTSRARKNRRGALMFLFALAAPILALGIAMITSKELRPIGIALAFIGGLLLLPFIFIGATFLMRGDHMPTANAAQEIVLNHFKPDMKRLGLRKFGGGQNPPVGEGRLVEH